MSNNAKDRHIRVEHLEYGYDFITLYFKCLNDANEFASRLYAKFKRIKFEHMELQRKNFAHQPGDPDHFHTDGEADVKYPGVHSHFHIIYPDEPTEADWEYLYKMANDNGFKITLDDNLVKTEVQR